MFLLSNACKHTLLAKLKVFLHWKLISLHCMRDGLPWILLEATTRNQIPPQGTKFLLVLVEYFTKWNEAKPFSSLEGAQVRKFLWSDISCRYGLSKTIISDNEKSFNSYMLNGFYAKNCISLIFSFGYWPRMNVQVISHTLGILDYA